MITFLDYLCWCLVCLVLVCFLCCLFEKVFDLLSFPALFFLSFLFSDTFFPLRMKRYRIYPFNLSFRLSNHRTAFCKSKSPPIHSQAQPPQNSSKLITNYPPLFNIHSHLKSKKTLLEKRGLHPLLFLSTRLFPLFLLLFRIN